MLPLLSILTPAVPSRIAQVDGLIKKLAAQIGALPVEHLVFLDNKRRSVGEKRDALLRMARGNYVAFVDDDDDVSNNYVEELLKAINYTSPRPDVITFLQHASVDDQQAIIEFKLGNPNEAFVGKSLVERTASPLVESSNQASGSQLSTKNSQLPRVRRNAWHICAWRRTLAIQSAFPASNYGEDWAYAAPLCAMAQRQRPDPSLRGPNATDPEAHIPKILHYYRHSSATTEAPPGRLRVERTASPLVESLNQASGSQLSTLN